RRYFKLEEADRARHLELQFDGVGTHCTVWVNGVIAHRNWCGYTSFAIDITPFAHYGEDVNNIAVRVDAEAMEGWWYEGAGIYRHTWLVKRDPVHIATDGVYANPVRSADGSWSVPVEVTLSSSATAPATVNVETRVIDSAGAEVGHGNAQVTVKPFEASIARYVIAVASPKLWSVDEPALYHTRTVIKRDDGTIIDEADTQCGFRTIRFDPNEGFFLNDQHLKLQGTCNHQDHAGVGAAMPDSIWDFRVRRLKEMGANAYRCAHNPPAAEFLAACDRMGMLVMDENRNFNTTPEYMGQLQWLIRRDRNHPSVILWSVFNEEPSQGNEQGYEMVRRMSAAVKELDVTRPVTAAQSSAMMNPVNASQAADVAGFNYQHRDYDRYHAANPTKPITSSEDTSAVMTRGEYTTDHKRAIIDSYDTQFQRWGNTHRNGWREIAERPFLAGGFVWTGFDYRGEPQPLEWPATGSSFGCMDLCGFPKTAYYIHQAQWISDRPIVQIVPHWNWPGREGKRVHVMVITNAQRIALSLNGKSLGEKPVDKYQMVSWDVPYEAGKLEAIATNDGKEVARSVVQTGGAPAMLRLIADRASLAGDGRDAQPITVEALDAEGRIVPTANLPVTFDLSGPGAIIGVGNGNPNAHEPEKGNKQSIFNGYAQAIVQSTPGGSGRLTLHAAGDGVAPADVTIDVTPTAAPPEIAPAKPTVIVLAWRMSPMSNERPDPNQSIDRNDVNTWAAVRPGRLTPFNNGKFAVLRATFHPRQTVRESGGQLVMRNVTGKAEVWIDGKLAAEKKDAARGSITAPLPPGEGDRTVSVLIESDPGTPAGLGGVVTVE
ncbi:MAG TPA: beta-galactosidase GalA, partial [Tepidisphaeraceae bacterium]|nr:beta-galactosidase GalA [Tepidisphaeraceae bacterium]